MQEVTVIMPVHNMGKGIISSVATVRDYLERAGYEYQIVVVDDGSTDDTVMYCGVIERWEDVEVICMGRNQGKGAAILAGCKRIRHSHVLFIDSDLQISLDELDTFFRVMHLYNAQAVIGNKRHVYSQISYNFKRKAVSNVYNYICRKLFGIQLRDTQCGFKLFKASAIREVTKKMAIKRFAYDIELLVILNERGYRIVDAPIKMKPQDNRGSISFKNILETFRDTVKVWIKKKRGEYEIYNHSVSMG